jgi:hypothetical protein
MPVNLSNLTMSRVSAGTSGSATGGDPYWNDVSFLLETATPSSITDATGKTITNSGITVSGSVYQVGTSSAYANGSSYLYASPDAAFNFGTGDFTMEGWFYLTADADVNPAGRRDATIMGCWPDAGLVTAWSIFILGNGSTTGTGLVLDTFSGGTESYLIANTTISKNAWTYFALVNQSNTATIYINGVAINSGAFAAPVNSGGNAMRVACLQQGGAPKFYNYFPGNLQQLRITKGVARYTADFTPPAQPFPTN